MSALCTVRVVAPLMRLLEQRGEGLDPIPEEVRSADPDDRLPVDLVHGAIEAAVEHFGDPRIGLKLGNAMSLGEVGTFDYVLRSAPTVDDSMAAASRYAELQADRYQVCFETWSGGGLLRMLDESSWPEPIGDLAMAAAYKVHVGQRAPFTSKLECWLPYAAPANLDVYERVFPGATLRFGAPFHAFAFDGSYHRAPQPGSDPVLHELLRGRLDVALEEVRRAATATRRVRRAIEHQLARGGEATAPSIARSMHMSRRTLSRRLEQEGTTFAGELDGVRRQLALALVGASERSIAEIASHLGFAHPESFHRAFKRWTGLTPLAERARSARRAG